LSCHAQTNDPGVEPSAITWNSWVNQRLPLSSTVGTSVGNQILPRALPPASIITVIP
jgi:hypothetical protein